MTLKNSSNISIFNVYVLIFTMDTSYSYVIWKYICDNKILPYMKLSWQNHLGHMYCIFPNKSLCSCLEITVCKNKILRKKAGAFDPKLSSEDCEKALL